MPSETNITDRYVVSSENELRRLYGKTHDLAAKKCLPSLDRFSRAYISRSPFICLSTQSASGSADVSPRGDPAGFVRVIDDTTLVIPDRPGNNRLDSLSNILSNPAVGILFMVPGFDDTLRVNGKAFLTEDPDLLESMTVHNRKPTLAIVVNIDEVFLHCAKAFRRAGLWQTDSRQDRSRLPSLAAMVSEQVSGESVDPAVDAKLAAELEQEYQRTMY